MRSLSGERTGIAVKVDVVSVDVGVCHVSQPWGACTEVLWTQHVNDMTCNYA